MKPPEKDSLPPSQHNTQNTQNRDQPNPSTVPPSQDTQNTHQPSPSSVPPNSSNPDTSSKNSSNPSTIPKNSNDPLNSMQQSNSNFPVASSAGISLNPTGGEHIPFNQVNLNFSSNNTSADGNNMSVAGTGIDILPMQFTSTVLNTATANAQSASSSNTQMASVPILTGIDKCLRDIDRLNQNLVEGKNFQINVKLDQYGVRFPDNAVIDKIQDALTNYARTNKTSFSNFKSILLHRTRVYSSLSGDQFKQLLCYTISCKATYKALLDIKCIKVGQAIFEFCDAFRYQNSINLRTRPIIMVCSGILVECYRDFVKLLRNYIEFDDDNFTASPDQGNCSIIVKKVKALPLDDFILSRGDGFVTCRIKYTIDGPFTVDELKNLKEVSVDSVGPHAEGTWGGYVDYKSKLAKFCFKCRGYGHMKNSPNCPESQKDFYGNHKCVNCGAFGHTASRCKKPRSCRDCGSGSHLAGDSRCKNPAAASSNTYASAVTNAYHNIATGYKPRPVIATPRKNQSSVSRVSQNTSNDLTKSPAQSLSRSGPKSKKSSAASKQVTAQYYVNNVEIPHVNTTKGQFVYNKETGKYEPSHFAVTDRREKFPEEYLGESVTSKFSKKTNPKNSGSKNSSNRNFMGQRNSNSNFNGNNQNSSSKKSTNVKRKRNGKRSSDEKDTVVDWKQTVEMPSISVTNKPIPLRNRFSSLNDENKRLKSIEYEDDMGLNKTAEGLNKGASNDKDDVPNTPKLDKLGDPITASGEREDLMDDMEREAQAIENSLISQANSLNKQSDKFLQKLDEMEEKPEKSSPPEIESMRSDEFDHDNDITMLEVVSNENKDTNLNPNDKSSSSFTNNNSENSDGIVATDPGANMGKKNESGDDEANRIIKSMTSEPDANLELKLAQEKADYELGKLTADLGALSTDDSNSKSNESKSGDKDDDQFSSFNNEETGRSKSLPEKSSSKPVSGGVLADKFLGREGSGKSVTVTGKASSALTVGVAPKLPVKSAETVNGDSGTTSAAFPGTAASGNSETTQNQNLLEQILTPMKSSDRPSSKTKFPPPPPMSPIPISPNPYNSYSSYSSPTTTNTYNFNLIGPNGPLGMNGMNLAFNPNPTNPLDFTSDLIARTMMASNVASMATMGGGYNSPAQILPAVSAKVNACQHQFSPFADTKSSDTYFDSRSQFSGENSVEDNSNTGNLLSPLMNPPKPTVDEESLGPGNGNDYDTSSRSDRGSHFKDYAQKRSLGEGKTTKKADIQPKPIRKDLNKVKAVQASSTKAMASQKPPAKQRFVSQVTRNRAERAAHRASLSMDGAVDAQKQKASSNQSSNKNHSRSKSNFNYNFNSTGAPGSSKNDRQK